MSRKAMHEVRERIKADAVISIHFDDEELAEWSMAITAEPDGGAAMHVAETGGPPILNEEFERIIKGHMGEVPLGDIRRAAMFAYMGVVMRRALK